MSASANIHEDIKVAQILHDLALDGYRGPGKAEFESKERYRWLKDFGTRLWLDTGDLAAAEKVWSRELEALTTNNTLVNQVVETGQFDGLVPFAVRKLRGIRPDISERDLIIEMAFLINAKLALTLVETLGAHVSVELHPNIGFDIRKTLTFARRYYAINPEYFYVKIPLTPAGFISTRLLSLDGVPINYTLGFSARQNYLAALFSKPRFVNVFLGRLNTVVEENRLGAPENVGEKATLASFEMVRQLRETHTDIETQQIAASIRSGNQVAALAGVDVFTIPPKVAEEFLGMDIDRDRLRRYRSQDLYVELNHSKPTEIEQIRQLWTVDAEFISFAQDAARQAGQMKSGEDMVSLSNEHKVNLFGQWSEDDRRKIREKGKIPDLSQWPGAPLDDLMSTAAFEAFAKDQEDLDTRIARLIHI